MGTVARRGAEHAVRLALSAKHSRVADGGVRATMSQVAPRISAKSIILHVPTCEALGGGVSIYIPSLPRVSLERERVSRGKFKARCSAGRRGGNRPKNWRERVQIRNGKTPWLASAGTTVPAGAPSSFRF